MWCASRRLRATPAGLRELCEFLGSHPDVTEQNLRDPDWMQDFAASFARTYFRDKKAGGRDVFTHIKQWNGSIGVALLAVACVIVKLYE